MIVLGVTGGIAAYKACEIVRLLRKRHVGVTCVLTRGGAEFITAGTLQALSGRKVITTLFDPEETDAAHIALSRSCRLLLVAPATANVLGKLAAGIADDFLTTFALAHRGPLLLAPAMNPRMWGHPSVEENVRVLAERGARFVGPGEGAMAEDEWGVGRLAEPEAIVEAALDAMGWGRTLAGQHLLVTAGPTREAIDAVRYLSNPSSGKMGFAVASAAARRGAEVTLVSGPTEIADPEGVRVVRVTSAAEMRDAVMAALPAATIVVKAAAVSDFAPAHPVSGKVKKESAAAAIDLVRTPDILGEIGSAKEGRFLVGFAAETEDLVANARVKLAKKNLDLIVANDVGSGGTFGADEGEAVILDRSGEEMRLGRLSKSEIAERLLDLIEKKVAA